MPRKTFRTAVLLCGTALLTTACGQQTTPAGPPMPTSSTTSMPSMPSTSSMPSMPSMTSMPGMSGTSMGDGLAASALGFTFVTGTTTLPTGASTFTFQITGPDGKPVTYFQVDQTKLMHLYLIRDDLTGFQHLHPAMAPDGTWAVPLTVPDPGSYRVYVTFTSTDAAGKSVSSVLSHPLTVSGSATTSPVPPPASTTGVDGYALALSQQPHQLALQVTRDGAPVTDLQPYLGSLAHLSAFHVGDLAFAHLHPVGTGQDLVFDTDFPRTGDWRLFVQFQTSTGLHTAALTIHV